MSDDKPKKTGGAHAKKAQSVYIQRSSRMRVILIVVAVVLVVLIGGLIFFGFHIFQTAENTATQQTQTADNGTTSLNSDESAKDSSENVTKKTTVPDLVELLGHTQEEAIAMLGHGAQVTRSGPVNEEGNPVRLESQVALTEEPSDTKSGTPTVYLSMNEAGAIIQVGYSVATSMIGYGSVSFSDMVENENIIEKTLDEAGLTVTYGSVELPEDRTEYSTYGSDGTTLVKEYCGFNGTGMAEGYEHSWEAVLSYDYSIANATDNLNDTTRTVYIYINA